MTVFATDFQSLVQVVYVSVIAGVSISVLFSLVVFGGARAHDARRAGAGGAAAAYALLTATAFVLFALGVVLGVQTMVTT